MTDTHISNGAEEAEAKTLTKSTRPARGHRPVLYAILAAVALLILLVGSFYGYAYVATPLDIRQPLLEHYHYRMQIMVDGRAVNFASSAFQEGYSKDNCNVGLTDHPFHFHDLKDQFVHIHWEGASGGQVLKYYGWNYIGGSDSSLGYRFDKFPKLVSVPIHGKSLPTVPSGDKFYVYSGDQTSYKQREFTDFTSQDLEKFFGKTSNLPAHQLNKQKRPGLAANPLEPKAYAAALSDGTSNTDSMSGMKMTDTITTADTTTITTPAYTQQDLTRINNLIGSVVIFVQKAPPTTDQIQARFNHLEPLSDSTCGG